MATAIIIVSIALFIPTLYQFFAEQSFGVWSLETQEKISTWIALILLLAYCAKMLFSLGTHRRMEIINESPRLDGKGRLIPLFIGLAVCSFLITLLSSCRVDGIEIVKYELSLSDVFIEYSG